MFSARAKVCGIIANPVEHSMSPILHNILAKDLGLDFIYIPFLVEKNLKMALEGAYELNIYGINVSLPYKQEIIKYIKSIDSAAKIIGAVNTLIRDEKNNSFRGTNTDYLGLEKALIDNDITIKNRDIIILGCGGAAKANIYTCLENNVKSISIFNRSKDRARLTVISLLKAYVRENNFKLDEDIDQYTIYKPSNTIKLNIYSLSDLENKLDDILLFDNYIAFQATNIGMYPNNALIVKNPKFYDKCILGIDLVYTPKITAFMKEFIKRDKKNISGLDMLINQGLIAFEIWNNIKVSDFSRNAAKKEIEKLLF